MLSTKVVRLAVTGLAFTLAVILAVILWRHYMYSPWTRDGRVKADVIAIAPDVSGLVTDVPVKDNGRVKKGDLLLVIDQERYKLELAQAEAKLEAARAEAGRLGAEARRRAGVGEDVVSREGHERAAAAAQVAEAQLHRMEMERDLARLNLARTEIRSPVDGQVLVRQRQSEGIVEAGAALLEVGDPGALEVAVDVLSADAVRIQPGTPVRLERWGGDQPLEGVTRTV